MLNLQAKKWPGKLREVSLGKAGLRVGGGTGLPLHTHEAAFPHRPLLALEVTDIDPPRFAPTLRAAWEGALGKPALAAERAVKEHGADLVMLHLVGVHPDRGDRSAEQAIADVGAVLAAAGAPLIVKGPGVSEKQNDVLMRVAERFAGEGLVLHSACQESYKTLAAAAVAYGHVLVAESPIDLNIAKQLNILLGDASVDLDRVLCDPLTGGLGYGLEYTYSVMERIRLAALGGDPMLSCPVICLCGEDVWKAKEVWVPEEKAPDWGETAARGIHWEVATALALLAAGADLLVLRHPEALRRVRRQLDTWFPRG